MGFPRQEYWSRLPFPSSRDQTNVSYLAGRFFTTEPPGRTMPDVTHLKQRVFIMTIGPFTLAGFLENMRVKAGMWCLIFIYLAVPGLS